jgi:2-hydroxymuconate-semialdehyde hydrolase
MAIAVSQLEVTTGALITHLAVTGAEDGHPLLLLHGTGPGASGQASFEPLLGGLRGFRCLVPDLIGFAESSHPDNVPPGAGPWLQVRVDAVRRVLDELRIERTHLLGHSYGCRVVFELLKREPERFGKVVLIAAGGTPVKANLQRLTDFYDNPTEHQMREMVLAQMSSDEVRDLDGYVSRRFALAERPEVQRSFESAMGPGEPAAVNDAGVLGTLKHEVLAVHGKADSTIPYAASLYLIDNLPSCDLHLFAHAGHQVQFEVPDVLATIISQFIGT